MVADLAVVLDHAGESATDRLARLDERAGGAWSTDARVWSPAPRPTSRTSSSRGTRAGYDGVRLRPAFLPDDLDAIVADLLPELRARGLARTAYDADSLRGLLALPTDVPNRFAA